MEDTGTGRKDTETKCGMMIKGSLHEMCLIKDGLMNSPSLFVPCNDDTVYFVLDMGPKSCIVLQC